jgi:GT2 family glycosyltransferase
MPWIQKCLNSVIESTVESKILVIDNCSSDETVNYIKNNYESILLFRQNKNLGFGLANNIGIGHAMKNNADYIYLLNQDAWVMPDTFEILMQQMKMNKKLGIISPMQLTPSKEKFDKNFSLYCGPGYCDKFLEDLYFNRTKAVYKTSFVNAAHWLITSNCIMTVGCFSPSFHHWGEDNNFIDRLHYHGFDAGICPFAIAIHDREYREFKANNHDDIVRRQYLRSITRLSQITKNENMVKLCFLAFYLILKILFLSFQYRTLLSLRHAAKLFFYLPAILKNRNNSKSPGPNFIAY